ncbi:MAG: gamma-glutamyltransferase family protein [Rhodoluna sp.]
MQTHRPVVYSRRGGAAASQPIAVAAALEILNKGGSFIDAGIALSAAISVLEPGASQLGGDAFLITHHAATLENLAFNGSGEASHSAVRSAFGETIDHHGPRSATVPGTVSAWFAAHERYGKLPMSLILAPAIRYADEGFAATRDFVMRIATFKKLYPDNDFFKDMGIDSSLQIGDVVVQKDLANTLRLISAGRDAFYEGTIADLLVSGTDGWFNHEDLAKHQTRVGKPLSVEYRGYRVHGQPPPTQGMILMEELRLVSGDDLAELSEADRIHLMVEAKKLAFLDRNEILADPEFIPVDVDRILSDEHITRRRAQISDRAWNGSGAEVSEGSDTTYFIVADDEGNAVSWIQSVFHGFGSAFVPKGTGILLNNRATGFDLDEKSPNLIEPGKRPAHTLNAWTVTNPDGSLKFVGGTPGANIQVQSNFQLVTQLIDLGLNVQESCEAPRWQHLNGDSSSVEMGVGTLQLEARFGEDVINALKAKGHDVLVLPDYGHGSAVQLLEVKPNGTLCWGSDVRVDGIAAGI